ncbi:MAG: FHA domain-containing protein [Chitinispirillaceae bacterium]
MSSFYLLTVKGTQKGDTYLLPEGAVSIGRSSKNTIVLPSEEKCVSGHHAIIYNSSGTILLQDLQSTNGTYVNGESILECELQVGDEVGFGKTGPRLKLQLASEHVSIENRVHYSESDMFRTTDETHPTVKKKARKSP